MAKEGKEKAASKKTCTRCQYKHTPRKDSSVRALHSRLNRIIGQLNGIKSMLDENRYCGDVLIQVSAAESALRLARTYERLAGSFPTRITARQGTIPFDFSSAVREAMRSRISAAVFFPSIITALIV